LGESTARLVPDIRSNLALPPGSSRCSS